MDYETVGSCTERARVRNSARRTACALWRTVRTVRTVRSWHRDSCPKTIVLLAPIGRPVPLRDKYTSASRNASGAIALLAIPPPTSTSSSTPHLVFSPAFWFPSLRGRVELRRTHVPSRIPPTPPLLSPSSHALDFRAPAGRVPPPHATRPASTPPRLGGLNAPSSRTCATPEYLLE